MNGGVDREMPGVVQSPSPFLKALIDSKDTAPNNNRFNGMNVYIADYCPICHRALNKDNNEDEKPNILAKRIITDPERRFITDKLLELLDTISKSYMNITIYDSDKNGIVDVAERALVADKVDWNNIENRPPNLTTAIIDELVSSMHKHNNKIALDAITIDTTKNLPLWDGRDWPSSTVAKEMPLASKSIRNTFIMPDTPSNSYTGDIWIENERNKNEIKAIHINKGGNQWISLSISEVSDIVKDKVLDSITSGTTPIPGGGSSIKTYTKTFSGNNVDKEYSIQHNLKSMNVLAQLFDTITNETVDVSFIRKGVNTIVVSFNKAPKPSDTYTVLLVKC